MNTIIGNSECAKNNSKKITAFIRLLSLFQHNTCLQASASIVYKSELIK